MHPETLSTLLMEAASRFSSRTALITPAAQLTYGALLERALRLATCLVETGLRPGGRVAICLPKGVDLSVAIFGTLLAGGAYVPIDHATPAARARLILADAEPGHLIATRQVADALLRGEGRAGEGSPRQEVVVAKLAAPWTREVERVAWREALAREPLPQAAPVHEHSIAYILYTSGSTGKPKGVIQAHRGAVAFVDWGARHLGLRSEDVLSQHASPSFDLTIFDFFASARVGAALVPVPEWLFGQVARTCRFIVKSGITVWYSVPSVLLRPDAESPLRELAGSALRHVVLAGEVIPKPGLRELARWLPAGCGVSNWFGPTETNVFTFHDIGPDDLSSPGPVPIGLPCPYARIRLEGATREGDEGELLVHAPTVMEGYRGLDALTAERFVAAPEGGAFYRTGDIARFENGRLVFLGRRDRLVKVRGYRVQLEEVEHALLGHPAVVEAAAVVFEEGGVEQLGAAVVPSGDAEVTLDSLRAHCVARLAPYMVPSRLVCLPALPRTPRGKVDTRAVLEHVARGGAPAVELSSPAVEGV
ncbi:amino acid adenylation domain-containing protein [Myxococcus sp. K15C18031901]|uniref:amino acid adenylation domain-containing protein n=1 Tax=Myxococcus dinghuensis TaxID=2906761 RepID=UPI0020A7D3A8|nr:amino acid adenylation domain-containing protein [Myxococcus dinghuensis]MCP3097325.1 amino acid adenylation domain-containing protein [Myxococcus dinghuensis]